MKLKTQNGSEISILPPSAHPMVATCIEMEVLITCETEDELLGHLDVIKKEIKRIINKRGEIDAQFQWEDDNCYGNHTVIINLKS